MLADGVGWHVRGRAVAHSCGDSRPTPAPEGRARRAGHSLPRARAPPRVRLCLELGRLPAQESQNVTQRFVQGLGVLDPEMPLVTVTPVPDGVKFTLPGPSVTFV